MQISVETVVPSLFIRELYVLSSKKNLGHPISKTKMVRAILQTRRAARFFTSSASGEPAAMRKRGAKQQLGPISPKAPLLFTAASASLATKDRQAIRSTHWLHNTQRERLAGR
jgi:hypothetical protein